MPGCTICFLVVQHQRQLVVMGMMKVDTIVLAGHCRPTFDRHKQPGFKVLIRYKEFCMDGYTVPMGKANKLSLTQ